MPPWSVYKKMALHPFQTFFCLFVWSSADLCDLLAGLFIETQSQISKGSCKRINPTSVRPPAGYLCSGKCSQQLQHAMWGRGTDYWKKLSFHAHCDLSTMPPTWPVAYAWWVRPNHSPKGQGKRWQAQAHSQGSIYVVSWHLVHMRKRRGAQRVTGLCFSKSLKVFSLT